MSSGKLTLTLPIYFGTKKKYLMSLNWYGTVHYRARNKVKQEFHRMIDKVVSNKKLKSPIKTHYKLYYKNKLSDADNIISVVDKFLMDALQEANVIENDNVQHYIGSSWEVIEQDRDNPRVEVIIEEM